jgi:DNA-directed RNA polymerase subunit M/transcription elongation factor TFIIS
MSGIKFCEKCGGILVLKKDTKGKMNPFCNACGFKEGKIDTKAYTISMETTGGKEDTATMIEIDREKQIEELKRTMGDRKTGASCPKCGSFYLTKSLVVTRGDEQGKTFRSCLACSYTFRRPKWVAPKEID